MNIDTLAAQCLENSPAGIMVLDNDLNIILWNSWLERASGIDAENSLERNLLQVLPSLGNTHLLDAIMLALNTGLPSVLTPKLNRFPLPLYRYSPTGEKHNFPQNIHVLSIRIHTHEERFCLVQINDVSSAFQREAQLRKQAEELEEQKQKLTSAWQEARRANEAKSMFLANVSHEIRTPLNAIIGLSHLSLQDAPPEGSIHDDLERIEQSGKLLLTLVNDILDFAKIDAGKMRLEKGTCEIDHIVDQLSDLFREQAQAKQIDLVFDIGLNVPLYIETDDLRLQQILINLINNAMKFTSSGEVRVCLLWEETPENPARGYLEIQVHDTGIGMDDAEIERLFQPFSQADESTSRKYGGTGLGLAITKRLVEMFGGTIKVTSTKGEGSCFAVNLPATQCTSPGISAPVQLQSKDICTFKLNTNQRNMLSRALNPWHISAHEIKPDTPAQKCALLLSPEGAVTELPPTWHQVPRLEFICGTEDISRSQRNDLLPEPLGARQIRRRIQRKLQSVESTSVEGLPFKTQMPLQDHTIMVVEDNAINRMIAEKILERMGATIIIAKDGEHALKQMDQHPEIEAILMDIQMPGMDGYTACTKLRQEPYSFKGPIIALTAHAMSDEPQRCRDAGMDEHVAKPFDPQQLLEVLRRNLHRDPQETLTPSEVETSSAEEDSPGDTEPSWNATRGLHRVNNDIELFKLLLERFLEQFCLQASQWDDFLSRDEAQQCAWMHNLKGVAANLGADALAQRARELEERLRTAHTIKVEPENFEQLYTLLNNSCTRMQTWLKEHNSEADKQGAAHASGVGMERSRMVEVVSQLLIMLAEHDLDALELWKTIRVPLGADLPDFIGRINTYMKNLEFEMASRHLRHWLSKQPEAKESSPLDNIAPKGIGS